MTKKGSIGLAILVGAFLISGINQSTFISVHSSSAIPTWNITMVNADDFWSSTNYRGENVKIAILDSGVNYTLPDLDGNYLGGYDYINNDGHPMDDYGHGTKCAAIAVGEGDYKYIGVAPKAKYFALKVAYSNGTVDPSCVDEAIAWALNNGADIISMSYGWLGYIDPIYAVPIEFACRDAL